MARSSNGVVSQSQNLCSKIDAILRHSFTETVGFEVFALKLFG
jgi:hypothetical protein